MGASVSIAEAFAERPARKGCKLGQALDLMTSTDRAALEKALSDSDAWTAGEIVDGLANNGVDISETTVKDHRNKRCVCKRMRLAA